jgi:hypothetical protein
MRRAALALLSGMVGIAMLTGPVVAASATVRTDPNDTRREPDIRKVWTDVSAGRLSVQIRTWDRLRHHDARFAVLFDTHGTDGYDRVIEVSGGECVVERMHDGSLGRLVGRRSAGFPGVRNMVCRMPSGWFAIQRTVRFVVFTGALGEPLDDRAPDHGRYIGL